jgi:eukaryotic-like serine/threonine-protein kinase
MPQDDDLLGRTLPLGEPTSAGSRFRILRPWREGGLGKVSIAQDEELHRVVALKEIKPEHCDDKRTRERFVLEAEITGALEHPGIVPIYGLGHYPDGRPYYAMRFVRGDSLEALIERFHDPYQAEQEGQGKRSLEFRKMLGRFIDVCNAVDYAHSRGVLHRDLKPGNVMLGKYGETLIVDWGLAKLLGKEDPVGPGEETPVQASSENGRDPTRMGMLVGTPGFMSPEQAAGRLDLVGPGSDVYSLGATLYCLLVGKDPFQEKDLGKLLERVQQGRFSRPSAVNKATPPGLEAICLKAMSVAPDARYASARLLADDIERWLADEPVTAYQEPPLAALWRWARHHRALVAAAAALLITAVVGLSISTALLDRAWLETEDARAAAVQAQEAAEEQRTVAAARAKEASERAEQILGFLQGMVFEVQDRLEKIPNTADLRSDLLVAAQQIFHHFIDSARDIKAPRTDAILIWAHLRLGQIYLLGGKTAEAVEQYQQGFEAAQKAAADAPDDPDAQGDLAAAYEKMGELILKLGNTAEARNFFERSAQICETLAQQNPLNADAAEYLPIVYKYIAETSEKLGDTERAAQYREKLQRLPKKVSE